MTTKTLTVRQRKSIFHALVETQDTGIPVPESKKKVAAKYRLSREQLEAASIALRNWAAASWGQPEDQEPSLVGRYDSAEEKRWLISRTTDTF